MAPTVEGVALLCAVLHQPLSEILNLTLPQFNALFREAKELLKWHTRLA